METGIFISLPFSFRLVEEEVFIDVFVAFHLPENMGVTDDTLYRALKTPK